MSRDLPPDEQVSLWRISQELVVLNGLLAAYLKYTVASARMATAAVKDPERMLQSVQVAADELDEMINEAVKG